MKPNLTILQVPKMQHEQQPTPSVVFTQKRVCSLTALFIQHSLDTTMCFYA